MTVLLRDEMILAALPPTEIPPVLSPASKAVYRCAERNLSVLETVQISKMNKEIVEQVICELISLKMVAVRPPSAPSSADDNGARSTLDIFFEKAEKSDHYELLGVDPDTSRVELRNKYFELSKKYHPDKAFKVSKEDKDKMTVIFQRLTVAYDVLSNPKRRAEYNEEIAHILELRAIEKNLKAAVNQENSTSCDPVPQDDAAPLSKEPPPTETERMSLNGLERGSLPPKYVPSRPIDPSADQRREEIRRKRADQALADLLRRRSGPPQKPPENGLSHLTSKLEEATRALSEQRYTDTIELCKEVLGAAPDNSDAKGLLKTASAEHIRVQVQGHLRRGRYAAREGQTKEAKWHFEQAAALDKENTEARHLSAELLLTQEKDFAAALALMKEVIVLGGQRARYFATLGDIFLAMKDIDRAADAYNKAMRLEPDNKELKKKLRLCKK